MNCTFYRNPLALKGKDSVLINDIEQINYVDKMPNLWKNSRKWESGQSRQQ